MLNTNQSKSYGYSVSISCSGLEFYFYVKCYSNNNRVLSLKVLLYDYKIVTYLYCQVGSVFTAMCLQQQHQQQKGVYVTGVLF